MSSETHVEGARVRRGGDWKWGDQDGGPTAFGGPRQKERKRLGYGLALLFPLLYCLHYCIPPVPHFLRLIAFFVVCVHLFKGSLGERCPVTQHCAVMRRLWKVVPLQL